MYGNQFDPNSQYNNQNNGQYGQYGYNPNNGQYGYNQQNYYSQYNPYGNANGYINQPFPAEGRINIVTHILLLLFTFGIWKIIWFYKTTAYLNCCPGEEYRNPTTKALLCLFIPFYSWYWIYKSSQRIDKMSAIRGVPSDSASINLILAIFIDIVPPILMQLKINDLTM